jgi:hypothetical protein
LTSKTTQSAVAGQILRLGSEDGAGHKAGAEEPHDCAMY